jgi:hypothetical protein
MLNITHLITKRLLGAAIVTSALIIPTLAFAQDNPSQDAPPYDVAASNTQIQGTVAAINGTWNITVHDANGYADSVALHQGTIINPTGLTLEPGMNVTIDGYSDGPNFDAVEIDTPYHYQGPAPVAVYYGPGSWYPGYAYGWGPSFSLAFNFGSRSFQQRSFYYGGVIRQPMAPPYGWQNSPHGYIGVSFNSSSSRNVYNTTRNVYNAPQRNYASPQQQYRSYAAPQQQYRSYAAPQAHAYAAPQGRAYAPQAHSTARASHGNNASNTDHYRN